jgi:hypothetical protein
MKQTPEEIIGAAVKVAALKAGIIDPLDAPALVDTSKVSLQETPYGVVVKGADEVVASLKETQPHLFLFGGRRAKDMAPQEAAEALASILRRPKPVPVETTKRASEMTEFERRQYLAEHQRRFG